MEIPSGKAKAGAPKSREKGGARAEEDEPEVVPRFWGCNITPGKDFKLVLTRTELKLTNAAIAATGGTARLTVSTPLIKNIVVCSLGGSVTQCLLDVAFFPEDESVTLRVEGSCALALAGSIAIFGGVLLVSDDEVEGGMGAGTVEEDVEEEEEEEEAPPVVAKPAAPTLSVVERLKRKRDEAAPAPAKVAKKEAASPSGPGLQELMGGQVKFRDLLVGTGPRPTPGKSVTVAYKGWLTGGKVFDTSDSFKFRLGTGQVIKGWDVGVAGMAVGGKRLLVIHPAQAYGARGAPPTIPPSATLMFEVELTRAST